MSEFHGVRKEEQKTSLSTPVTAASGIPFVVGTAPVHKVGGAVNRPVLAYSYAEAVAALGYSDDWERYTLCEMMHSHFNLYGMAPVIFVNVLDPAKQKTDIAAADLPVVSKQIKLPAEAIKSSVIVKPTTGGGSAYVADKDYFISYDNKNLIIEILKGEGANIPEATTELNVAYTVVKPETITDTDIIGGFDPVTYQKKGLELLDQVFPLYGLVPDLILAPGYSHIPEVSAVMSAKAGAINGIFTGKALIDADATTVKYYTEVPAWKSANNVSNPNHILFWPKGKLGKQEYHLSVQAAGLLAQVDARNGGTPNESPSNKNLSITELVAGGEEVILDLTTANFLNASGVVTANNFRGWKLWGNYTACYPSNNDVKDYSIPVSRMFDYIGNTVILTTWSRVDDPMNKRLISSIADSLNIWMNGLAASGKLLGGRVEFREDENPTTDLMAGKIKYHIYICPPGAAQDISFIIEYDASYLSELFGA